MVDNIIELFVVCIFEFIIIIRATVNNVSNSLLGFRLLLLRRLLLLGVRRGCSILITTRAGTCHALHVLQVC